LYGTHQGTYPVLPTLATLAFDYPARAKFFKKELRQYLLLTREQRIDPMSLMGSYAGAIGAPQFMPSSYRHYAVDFSGDGQANLQKSYDDTIASVANYLSKNGWRRNKPIATRAKVRGKSYTQLIKQKSKLKPTLRLNKLAKYGIKPNKKRPKYSQKIKAGFITLNKKTKPQYWLGFKNFYVITTYNPSINYAMAVYQLGEKIKHSKQQQLAHKKKYRQQT